MYIWLDEKSSSNEGCVWAYPSEFCKSMILGMDIQVVSGCGLVMNIICTTRNTVCLNVSCPPNLNTVKMKQTVTSDSKISC